MWFWQKADFWPAHYFKIIVEWDRPHFRKGNDEETQYTFVEWEFEKIEFKTIEFEDKAGKMQKRRVFDIFLKDGNERYVISSWFTVLSRTLLNTLLSAPQWELGKLSISLYKNKKGYNSIYVKNDNTTLDRKYSIDELKAKTKPIIDPDTNEVLKIKYDELEMFLEEQASQLTAAEAKF